MGFFKSLGYLFAAPSRLAEGLRERTYIGKTLLVLIVLALLSTPLMMKYTVVTTADYSIALAERYGSDFAGLAQTTNLLSGGSVEGVSDEVASFAQGVTTVMSIVGQILGYLLGALVTAVLMIIIGKILKGGANFKQYFSFAMYAAILSVVLTVIQMGISVALGTSMSFLSLAPVFMPNGSTFDPMFVILTGISVSLVWNTVLMYFGFKGLNGFSRGKALGGAFAICVLTIAFTVATSNSAASSMDSFYQSLQSLGGAQ